jgi:hypothetical protein
LGGALGFHLAEVAGVAVAHHRGGRVKGAEVDGHQRLEWFLGAGTDEQVDKDG